MFPLCTTITANTHRSHLNIKHFRTNQQQQREHNSCADGWIIFWPYVAEHEPAKTHNPLRVCK